MSLYQVPENIKTANDLTAKLEHLKNIKRSFSVYRIDCGSCNGCEIEIFAAITPMWDPERFGFKLVANPRHADILLCTGPVTRQMYYPLLRAYEAAPDPKIVVAFGACGSTGGIFYDAYSVWGGIDKITALAYDNAVIQPGKKGSGGKVGFVLILDSSASMKFNMVDPYDARYSAYPFKKGPNRYQLGYYNRYQGSDGKWYWGFPWDYRKNPLSSQTGRGYGLAQSILSKPPTG